MPLAGLEPATIGLEVASYENHGRENKPPYIVRLSQDTPIYRGYFGW